MGERLGLEKPGITLPSGETEDARSMSHARPAPHPDPPAEMERVLAASEKSDVALRAIGGVAVYLQCPSARREPLRRPYKDLDLVGKSGQAEAVGLLMEKLGYIPDREFNALHGHQRLYFWDASNKRQLDVFIDNFEMCHPLALKARLELDELTLSLADLLLTKLQVVEVNEKDLKDGSALLADHEIASRGIDPERILSVLSTDWGWWRTATENLTKVRGYATSLPNLEHAPTIVKHVDELLRLVQEKPKTLRWKLRARVGERVRWYTLPEEVEA